MAAERKDTEIEQSDLGAIISGELRNSTSYDQSALSQKRSLTLEYMRGIMKDIPARPNGSSQTSRDINDTISWMLPGIVRVFTATNKMVTYEQVKDEPPEWAEQATSYMNYSFFVQNPGYQILRNASYDALAVGNGVVCSYWDDEESKTESLRNQTVEDVLDLQADTRVTILAAEQGKPMTEDDPNTGEPVESPTFNLKIKRVISKGKVCDETCKPENLFLNTWATTIEDARFVGYLHDQYTRSDLMEMAKDYGWNTDEIEDLPTGQNIARNQVSNARNYDLTQTFASPIRSGDQINLYRCFLKADVDGDGIAELIEAWFAGDVGGGTVLGWELWEDDVPYTDIPCYPIPHRWDAESVSDRTIDIQRVKTVLLRGLLDSTYQSIMPQREVDLGSVLNPDILVNPRFGGIIWKKPGTAPITPHEIPYTGDKSLAAMQAMDEIISRRTGVSKTTMALDPDALQNQTATASQNMRDAAYSQIELVARDMAEYGWVKFFRKRLKLAIKYHEIADIPAPKDMPKPQTDPQQPQQPTPKFQQVRPPQWDENMAVNINVGLGTGSRDRDMAMLNNILTGQRQMAQELGAVDPAKAIDFLEPIRNTFIKMVESSGIKNPESYAPEISPDEIAQLKQKVSQGPAPDPRIAADMQSKQMDLQMTQLKIEGEQASQQSASQVAQIRAQAEIQSANSDATINQLKLQLAQQQMQDRDEIAGLKLQLQAATSADNNATKLKSQALAIMGEMEVARINKGLDQETMAFQTFLDAIIGVQEHEQAKELQQMSADQAAQVAAATPSPATNGAA